MKVYWNRARAYFFTKYLAAKGWVQVSAPRDYTDERQASVYLRSELQRLGIDPDTGGPSSGVRRGPGGGVPTLRSCNEAILTYTRSERRNRKGNPLSENYLGGIESDFKAHILVHPMADADLDQFNEAQAIRFVLDIAAKTGPRGEPLAKNTVRSIWQTFSDSIDACRALGLTKLASNPCESKLVRRHVPPNETRYQAAGVTVHLSAETFVAFIRCDAPLIPLPMRILYATAVITLARECEVFGFSIGHVSLKSRGSVPVPSVYIERQLVMGGPADKARFGPRKRGAPAQWNPLGRFLTKLLRFWIEPATDGRSGWGRYVGREPTAGDPLFPRPDGSYELAPERAAEKIRDHLGVADLPTHQGEGAARFPLTFHALRRTGMTLLKAAGVPQDDRDRLAGHRGGTVGSRHYEDAYLANLAEQVDRLPLPALSTIPWLPKVPNARATSGEKKVPRRRGTKPKGTT